MEQERSGWKIAEKLISVPGPIIIRQSRVDPDVLGPDSNSPNSGRNFFLMKENANSTTNP